MQKWKTLPFSLFTLHTKLEKNLICFPTHYLFIFYPSWEKCNISSSYTDTIKTYDLFSGRMDLTLIFLICASFFGFHYFSFRVLQWLFDLFYLFLSQTKHTDFARRTFRRSWIIFTFVQNGSMFQHKFVKQITSSKRKEIDSFHSILSHIYAMKYPNVIHSRDLITNYDENEKEGDNKF